MNADSIGNKIRIQRVIKGYSQEYMSFVLDISQSAYSNLERDTTEISVKRIFEIAEVLEISPFILMPKPKYGTHINILAVRHTLYKLGQLWTRAIKKRIPLFTGKRFLQ